MRPRGAGAALLFWLVAGRAAAWACELPPSPRLDGEAMFVVHPRETQIQFEADAGWHTFTGIAGKLSGRVRLAPTSPLSGAAACLEVDAASLTTGIDLRDERMRTRHLQTDRFPTIRFTLTGLEGVASRGDGRYTGTLRGLLALHGVTHLLGVPAEFQLEPTRLEVLGQVPLRLSAFDIPAPSFLFVTMRDEVMVRFRLRANRS